MKRILIFVSLALLSLSVVCAKTVKRGGDADMTPYLNESDARVVCKDIVDQVIACNIYSDKILLAGCGYLYNLGLLHYLFSVSLQGQSRKDIKKTLPHKIIPFLQQNQ